MVFLVKQRYWQYRRQSKCDKGRHRWNTYNHEGAMAWWSVTGERVYAHHCRDCGHWQELARR